MSRLPDYNQERRPITIELDLNVVTLFDGETKLFRRYELPSLMGIINATSKSCQDERRHSVTVQSDCSSL